MATEFAKNQPVGFSNRVEKVAIVGAGGSIGSVITKALLGTGRHQITALARTSSTIALPDGVRRVVIDYNDESTLVEALKGQDFLIITLGVSAAKDGGNAEVKLVKAAAAAGVPYVMPNAYGADPLNEKMRRELHSAEQFLAVKALIEKLGVSRWIVLGCGFWYEWSLVGDGQNRFGIDFQRRTVTFFDDGEERIATSTWDQSGRAVASFLSLKRLPDDENDKSPTIENWANRALYIASFRVNQKEMFESAKRVTGTTDGDWMIEYVASEMRFTAAVQAMERGEKGAFLRQMYTRVFFPTGEGDHSRHGPLANSALGLPVENIDEATKEGLRLFNLGALGFD
ncbi:NAD(P)-bd-dom domain-containing protein [Mycena chlorophos]|uniref:NAD(P)-bd-dom domain-containing protein n=1 Tax=Mycena chlorophos TaxID=658473 RepID=A0A8H6TLV6_MYCCL|nr:NAD(P)-bd-dom domain-containing protein [Mycena chlorophos]